MRFVTHYEEYPIYEPAEGGYYYAGNQVVESERMSKRKAKENFEEIWRDARAQNLEEFGSEEPLFDSKDGNYPWRRFENRIYRYSRYIGEGESYVIERHKGSEARGWRPYC